MKRPTAKLEAIGDEIRAQFTAMDAAREKGLRLARESIRFSSLAIRAVHRQEFDEARKLCADSRANIQEMGRTLAEYSELRVGGFVHDAQKECAEAHITLALITDQPIPQPKKLGVTNAAYLNGLGEAAGELRRNLLDTLRSGEMSRCEQILAEMDDIYALMVALDFPDAITGGLRRTTDVTRGILEKTRGDFTLIMRQKELERKIESLKLK